MTSRDKEMLDLAKCRIQFASPEGEYEGTVHVVCPVSKKMLVSNIVFLPKRTPMGTLSFNFREIHSYIILSRPNASDSNKDESTRDSHAYMPTRGQDTCLLDDLSEAGDAESDADVCVEDLYEEEAYELKIPPMFSGRISSDNIIIDGVGEEFHLAVRHIFQQDCIGVTLQGPQIGRNGILSWLGVSTSSCTFLFDIQNLGENAFKDGLKKIFENPNIEKVLHDCRAASDCLFHKYNTRLVNVFDTQVADLLVTMQRSQDCKFSKRVSPLDSCLRTYLEIPEEYIHKPKSYRSYEDGVVYSRLRPMVSDERDVVLKNVVYLRLLKRELNFAMLTPFHRAVEVYLQVLLTANDQELLLEPSIPGELPQELVLEGVQIVRFKEFVDVPPVVTSGPPFRKLHNPIKDYANYCAKRDKSLGSSSAGEISDSGDSIEMDNVPASVRVGAHFHEKPKIVGNRVSFRPDHTFGNVSSSNKIDKSTMKKSMESSTPPREECGSVDSVNSIGSDEKKSSPIGRHFNNLARQRFNQSVQNISLNLDTESVKSANPAEKKSSGIGRHFVNLARQRFNQSVQNISLNLDTESVKSANPAEKKSSAIGRHFVNLARQRVNRSIENISSNKNVETCSLANSQDSSDSDFEYNPRTKNYQDTLLQIRQSQKLLPSKESSYSESSSDRVDSSEEDPWAVLRAEFSNFGCSAETVKRNLRFVPA